MIQRRASCFSAAEEFVIKPIFAQGPSQLLRVVLAVVFALSLMVLDHRFTHLQQVRETLALMTHPLHVLADLPVTFGLWVSEVSSSHDELLLENRELREDNLKLRAQLQKYDTLVAENLRLRDLIDASYKVGDRVLIAELSAVDLDPFKQQVVVNKGSNSGAFIGQAVLDADAVMGQIVRTTPFSATVLLITDPSHAVPVRVARNGLRSIAIGGGKIDELVLPYLPTNSDIEVGDKLITSGLGGKFPSGYPVATVSRIDRSPDNAFAQIIATPAAHLDRSREVLLVWSVGTQNLPAPTSASEPAEQPSAQPSSAATPATPPAGTEEAQ